MIEVSDEKYWKYLTWNDALLYLSLFEIDGKSDWRMLTDVEGGISYYDRGCWYQRDDGNNFIDVKYWVIPVRDILED